MNFTWLPAQLALRERADTLFAAHPAPDRLRACADAPADPFDGTLWDALVGALGPDLTGTEVRDQRLAAAVVAEAGGRALAPVPLAGALTLLTAGVASGLERTACVLGVPGTDPARIDLRHDRASGRLTAVPDGLCADVLLTTAGADAVLVDLTAPGVRRRALPALDLAHGLAWVELHEVPARRVPGAGARVCAHAAILTAFEQVGGAQRCLDLAAAYARERIAFGQPIGAFQAVKHELAKLHVEIELARSNAWYAAWALAENASELQTAACLARASATDTYARAAQECIHLHGGVGFTWANEGHVHLRRARALEGALGDAAAWGECLLAQPGAVAGL